MGRLGGVSTCILVLTVPPLTPPTGGEKTISSPNGEDAQRAGGVSTCKVVLTAPPLTPPTGGEQT